MRGVPGVLGMLIPPTVDEFFKGHCDYLVVMPENQDRPEEGPPLHLLKTLIDGNMNDRLLHAERVLAGGARIGYPYVEAWMQKNPSSVVTSHYVALLAEASVAGVPKDRINAFFPTAAHKASSLVSKLSYRVSDRLHSLIVFPSRPSKGPSLLDLIEKNIIK